MPHGELKRAHPVYSADSRAVHGSFTPSRGPVMSRWLDPRMTPALPCPRQTRPLANDDRELEELVTACGDGRVSDVVAWVDAGKPLQARTQQAGGRRKASALQTAIETGQHDLVRFLLASGCQPELESRVPFDLVLRSRRWDLLDLLFQAGADPNLVDPDAIFGTYRRDIMERFLGMGVDIAGDGALADALAYETSNRPLYGFVKCHTDDPRIQREVDTALGCAIGRENDKAVSLCLWAGANPRHSVPVMGDGRAPSDDWTMTAFERAVWSRAPKYLKKLGFDPARDEIDTLYGVTFHASEIEALAEVCPPADWHPITERLLDHTLFSVELGTNSDWGARSQLKRVFRVGGNLRELSNLTKRRLRKHLKERPRDDARKWIRLLQHHMEERGFLDLIGYPAFLDDYESWGIKRAGVQALAAGKGGSRAAVAIARRILKAEAEKPPVVRVPWNRSNRVCVGREELHEIVWSLPMTRAAKRFGLSDNGLRKACKKLCVPTPPRGYWAGGSGRRRPLELPEAKPGWPEEVWLPLPRRESDDLDS